MRASGILGDGRHEGSESVRPCFSQQQEPHAKGDCCKDVKLEKYIVQVEHDILAMLDGEARDCEVMRKCRCSESTVQPIKKNCVALPAFMSVFTKFSTFSKHLFSDTSQQSGSLLLYMEHYLNEWTQ